METYSEDLKSDRRGFMGIFKRAHVHFNINNPEEALYQILKHGIYEKGKRTHKVLLELGWINNEDQINILIPGLKKASQQLMRSNPRPAITV